MLDKQLEEYMGPDAIKARGSSLHRFGVIFWGGRWSLA